MLSPKTLKRMRDLETAKRDVVQKQGGLVQRLKKDLAKIGLTVSPIRDQIQTPPAAHPGNKIRLARVVQLHNRRNGKRRRKAA